MLFHFSIIILVSIYMYMYMYMYVHIAQKDYKNVDYYEMLLHVQCT